MVDMFVNDIRKKYSKYIKNECKEHGCMVDLGKISDAIILDGDELIGSKSRSCDCIIFDMRNGLHISIIELKSTYVKSDEVIDKFTKTKEQVMNIMNEFHYNGQFFITLTLLIKSDFRNFSARFLFRGATLSIRDKVCKINLEKCGYNIKKCKYQNITWDL